MNGTILKICSVILISQIAGGCAALDRRTLGTMVEDETIEQKTRHGWAADEELSGQAHLNVTSYNGRVLLTGEAPTEALRTRAVEQVLNVPKVQHVYNEITIAAPSSMTSRSSDTLITSKVKTRLLADEFTSALNMKVVTENGVVYLMGIVPPEEADQAVELTRQVGGVQRVVNLFQKGTGAETISDSGSP